MKKRMLGTFLAVLMMAALALSGCGASDSGESTEAAETTAETTAEVTEALEETGAVTEAATTEAATETEESTVVLDVDGDGTVINFGDNQNSAAEMPMNTKLYGSLGDGYYWFSFTTDSDANADNRVTLINKTSTTGHVYANIYDEYGTELASGDAGGNGLASTFSVEGMSANTTYYVRLSTQYGNPAVVMVMIRNFNSEISSIMETEGTAVSNTVTLASNQDDAGIVPVESKIAATATGGYQYFAFVPEVSGEYMLTLVNETSTTGHVYANVYDEYGTELASGDANDSGTASTFSMGELTTGCVYYIRISTQYDNEADYTFTIREPEVPIEETAEVVNEGATAAIIEEETAGIVEDVETAAIIEE
ncbi:MAG: hypothetical protein LUF00_03075 [Lachnospiraceae bacterium]|nr:hypothetical protein [Lachnospiraceae bacterium]